MKNFVLLIMVSIFVLSGKTVAQTKSSDQQRKSKIKDFHRELRKDMHRVLENNPEKYEVKTPSRGPASVAPQPQLDRSLSEENLPAQQGIGLPKW